MLPLFAFVGSIWYYLILGIAVVGAIGALIYLRKQNKEDDE